MFSVPADQRDKLDKWIAENNAGVARQQGGDSPYYGGSGGSLTYSFTPTSLGLIVKVTNNMTGQTIDLTDYESW